MIQLRPAPQTLIGASKAHASGIVTRLIALTCAVLLVACQPLEAVTARPTVIRIAGAAAMQPVLYDLTAAFRQRHPNVLFELTGEGSSVGEERLFAGQVDLAASTLVSPTVPGLLLQNRRVSSYTRTPIGLDGLVLIVHQDNPVENLTLEQLQALYSGRSLNWEDVGGLPAEVLLTSREDNGGSRQLFEEQIMGDERVSLTAVVLPTDANVVDYVAENVNAIGYVSHAYVVAVQTQANEPTDTASVPPIRMVAIEGQLPTLPSIQDQSYPLIQPIYLVSRMRPRGWLQQFIDFVLSPAGQAIVARYHARVR